MAAKLEMAFSRRPSTLAYMLRAFHRSSGLRKAGRFPSVRASWRPFRSERRQLELFAQLTGLHASGDLPILFPHVFGFPLQMAILTHPAFPLPIWGALQIRNHLLLHRPLRADAELELETSVAEQRILGKGAEVDLRTRVRSHGELLWESLNTFYYRGRYGDAGAASALAQQPKTASTELARWRTQTGVGWRFGGLTGDYNGIHWSRWYARSFGFPQAFHHPQLVLGQCMARLPAIDPAAPQRLDAWLKGPVFYDSEVRLQGATHLDRNEFSLLSAGEQRPAIVASWRRAERTEAILP